MSDDGDWFLVQRDTYDCGCAFEVEELVTEFQVGGTARQQRVRELPCEQHDRGLYNSLMLPDR